MPHALVVGGADDGLEDAMDILEDAGFLTSEASHGDTALLSLDQEHAAIVLPLTDAQMPGSRDGFAVARETARQWPHIAIVVASGHVQPGPDDMPEGARFIGKPFNGDMVHDHIEEILPDERKPGPLRNWKIQQYRFETASAAVLRTEMVV